MPQLHVSSARWNTAQEWEKAHWVRAARRSGWRRVVWPVMRPFVNILGLHTGEGDDWNSWWADQFDQYGFLPQTMDNYIEVGCGPFTNTRKILEGRTVKHIFLSDPLARTYAKFKDRWLGKHYRQVDILLDDHALEDCPYASDYFDCVVMINVLDHVQDANLCMQHATRIVKPGGTLIIGQELTSADEENQLMEDPGHPIWLQREDLDRHLANFTAVHRKDLKREEGRDPENHYSTLIFAGRKNAAG